MPSGIRLSVNLENIIANAKAISNYSGVKVCAMVKSNAYGHGLVPVVKALQRHCDFFGVARLTEALAVRNAARGEILVCSDFDPSYVKPSCDAAITLTAASAGELAGFIEQAELINRLLFVHIKVDSGMNRLGIKSIGELKKMLSMLKKTKNVRLTGIYTHFCDCQDKEYTDSQFETFLPYVDLAKKYFPDITSHCASSSAIFSDKKYFLDMVRPGLSLYGYDSGAAAERGVVLKPALTVEAEVLAVKKASKGETIGYGRNYQAGENMHYAVISAGYGDGYKRCLSNCGNVYVNGEICPVCGNICMDMFMVKVSDKTAKSTKRGDKAILLSDDMEDIGGITLGYLAQKCGTIKYEILTSFTERVKREYIYTDAEQDIF